MKGLIIKGEWLEKIFNEGKVWEIRGSNTTIRGLILLIESGTGCVVGQAEIIDSKPLTAEDFYNNLTKHCLPVEVLYHSDILKKYRTPYRWTLTNVKKYEKPVSYKHPKGAVIWVNVFEKEIWDILCTECVCNDCFKSLCMQCECCYYGDFYKTCCKAFNKKENNNKK